MSHELKYDVVALGELLIDFAPRGTTELGYPVLAANPGGAPGNFLAALSRYGMRTGMLGKVGDDMYGHMLLGTLKKAGIDAQGVVVDGSVFTTLAFVSLDENGNRDFSFARKPGADTCLKEAEVRKDMIEACRVFHFGTLSLTAEPVKTATCAAINAARNAGKLISLDPNLRKPLWESEDKAREMILWSLQQADIVKISDEEIEFLWGIGPEEGAQKLLSEFGVSLLYGTLGPKGCYARTRHACVQVASPSGIQVKDTTGAGDIFGGSAMSRFLSLNKAPDELEENELEGIVRFACTAASLSTQVQGGITSVPEEVDVIARLS